MMTSIISKFRPSLRGCAVHLSYFQNYPALRDKRVQISSRYLHTCNYKTSVMFFATNQSDNKSEITMSEYHKFAESTLQNVLEHLEALLERVDMDESDVEYSSGVLTLKLGVHGTFVLNKQPPNKQIWLSSPVSGPKRFDFSKLANNWLYLHTNETLTDVLEKEIYTILGLPLQKINIHC